MGFEELILVYSWLISGCVLIVNLLFSLDSGFARAKCNLRDIGCVVIRHIGYAGVTDFLMRKKKIEMHFLFLRL